ncbi:hypothetical protein [Conexibacter sp. CPCC 206217]|uniref:hypothetical protein n=1 Tax=Conexibacter sp. CPCC 206217 TaxID=3064574 RepID=UPI002715F997|nr:hypothetical protein [Conexibacter sp. CPCC 206217]MDO8210615.1 hypothetical protein [Conexibacter sp. CPCC 206217]
MRPTLLFASLLLVLILPAAAHAADPLPPATEISQPLSLQEAAAAGIVDLRPKGGFGGDSVAVDLTGARVRGAPVVATVRIEFLGTQKDGTPWPQSKADEIAAAIARRLAGSKSSDGTPFSVEVVARVRAGSDPLTGGTPGYHQIVLEDRPRASDASMVSGRPFGPNGEKSGSWGTNETTTTLAHETGHLLGIGDRYTARKPEWIGPDGQHVKLPEYRGAGGDMRAMNAWWDSVVRASDALDARYGRGDIQPGIPRGGENDIMADGTGAEHDKPIIPGDVDRLIASAGVRMRANPGDVLANKSAEDQNMVVGAPLDLYAPKGGTVHRDGLFAYCIDLHRHVPKTEGRFDVLGPAAALATTYPQYAALQQIVDEIARRQADPAVGLGGPLGANDAIWAVTDASPLSSPEGEAILAAAGVAFDAAAFAGSPHFVDPNAAGATTAGVSPTGVLPAVAADRTPPALDPALALPAARLGYLRLRSGRVRANRRTAVTLRSLQDGSATRWSVTLQRRGGSLKSARTLPALTLPAGPDVNVIRLPRLKRGHYRLVLSSPDGGTRRLAVTAVVVRKKRHARRAHRRG